jgi:hypothetical protein
MCIKEISEMTMEELTEYRAEAVIRMQACIKYEESLFASVIKNKIRGIDSRLEYLKYRDVPVTF